jgi:hypothetical protein
VSELVISVFIISHFSAAPCESKDLKGKVDLSLCLTKHQRHEDVLKSGGIAPSILDLGTR